MLSCIIILFKLMFYQVKDQKFTNKYLGARHALATGQELYFNMYDDAFDRVNWNQEPESSWEQLLDIRARQIQAKNKPIVLNFTGGTDSLTIYRAFERNKIHIDIIYIRARATDFDRALLEPVKEFLDKNLYDPTTRVIIREDTEEVFGAAYSDSDWVWHQNGVRLDFGLGFAGDVVTDAWLATQLGTDDFISVNGFDKPKLTFDWHGVYAYQVDYPLNRAVGSKTLDCFYISPDLPELHVKQNYMLLRYIKSLKPGGMPRDLIEYNNVWNCQKFPWLDYSVKGCGREMELNAGSIYHIAFNNIRFHLPSNGKFYGNEHEGPGQNWFSSLVGTKTLKNYLDGVQGLLSDSVGKYLFTDPDDTLRPNVHRSKLYKLNFFSV
jgi:hypothetical protein